VEAVACGSSAADALGDEAGSPAQHPVRQVGENSDDLMDTTEITTLTNTTSVYDDWLDRGP